MLRWGVKPFRVSFGSAPPACRLVVAFQLSGWEPRFERRRYKVGLGQEPVAVGQPIPSGCPSTQVGGVLNFCSSAEGDRTNAIDSLFMRPKKS